MFILSTRKGNEHLTWKYRIIIDSDMMKIEAQLEEGLRDLHWYQCQ